MIKYKHFLAICNPLLVLKHSLLCENTQPQQQ